MLRRVALIRTDVSEETIATIVRLTRIGELGTTLAVTGKRYVPPNRRFLQEQHGVTSQKTTIFIVTAVKTSNLTLLSLVLRCNYIATEIIVVFCSKTGALRQSVGMHEWIRCKRCAMRYRAYCNSLVPSRLHRLITLCFHVSFRVVYTDS
jgi:hypothetical protein